MKPITRRRRTLVSLLALSFIVAAAALALPRATRAAEPVDRPGMPLWNTEAQGRLITAIATAGETAWVGTEAHGLWDARPGGDRWSRSEFTGPAAGDNSVRAIAVDRAARLWVGHGSRGVSVYNGHEWKNYDAPEGPLGHRVFRIAVSPLDGDVWMATDLGLARYSISNDDWSHFTRAEGLPSDQAAALAFARDGTLYVGTQCDGLAIGSPSDNYATWRRIVGPEQLPTDATGKNLPSNLINDILVMRDGAVFVATCGGLSASRDEGKSWTFVRGRNYAEKVRESSVGPPPGWAVPPDAPPLAEDDVKSLAEDAAGGLWVGYRKSGFDLIDARTLVAADRPIANAPAALAVGPGAFDYVACIAPAPIADTMWLGTIGQALVTCPIPTADAAPAEAARAHAPARKPSGGPAALPSPLTIGAKRLDAMRDKLAAAKRAPLAPAYLGEDWQTSGDGAGRYGWQKAAYPFYGIVGWANGYGAEFKVGPSATAGGPYTYFDNKDTPDPRGVYVPNSFTRLFCEWNDGSFDAVSYPDTFEGPDLWIDVEVPSAGVHRMTLLFSNYDGHVKQNRFRDYLVEIKPADGAIADADLAPALAQTRVREFYHSVYKQFLLPGGQKYRVKVGRNYSFVAKLSAVYFDRVQGQAKEEIDSLPSPLLDPGNWGPPKAPDAGADEPAPVREARRIWEELDGRYDDASAVPLQRPLRLLAYRLAATNGAPAELLANWRWHLQLWDEADRLEFCRQMDAGYQRTIQQNPNVKSGRKSMVDLYHEARANPPAGAPQPGAAEPAPPPEAAP